MSNFKTDIRFLKGVGEKRAQILYNMGIDTVGALLRFYPRAYEDFSKITPIFDCNYNEKVCIKATIITEISEQYIRKNMTVYKFCVADGSGSMNITLFNNKYLAAKLQKGHTYLFLGKLSPISIIPSMSSPEIREVGSVDIEPIYSAVKSIGVQNFRKMVKNALTCEMPDDPIPQEILEKHKLLDLKTALENIHFPKSKESLERAKERLVFEELLILQLSLNILKKKHKRQSPCVINKDFSKAFEALLPFSLTTAQQNAIKDSILDMQSGRNMNRLIQGDVGSGKTAVAASLIYTMAKNSFQSALMAPTEILAEQHFSSLSALFKDSNI